MNVCQALPTGHNRLRSGPFVPGQAAPVYFALYADDCLLHFSRDELTPKQREDDRSNVVLTAMLQVALTFMGRGKDHAALHELFKEQPWADALAFYHETFTALFDDVIPMDHYHYFPTENFYEAIAVTKLPAELLGLYMVSGSNFVLHGDKAAWELSKRVNSKMHFAATAPGAGLPVPETLVCRKADLDAPEVDAFFARHGRVMVKVQGLAGARNVTTVTSTAEALDYLHEFAPDIDVALQERLSSDAYTEMTVDLTIADDGVSITNVREILFADGLWVGNYISDRLELSERQRQVCLAVGEYVRELGYVAPEGFNCGIDFFVRGDDIVVIEINARWTGGLFPAHLIQRLGVEHEHSVAFIDVISRAALPRYLQFIRDHVNGDAFRFVPMGFSPFVQDVDGLERLYVWQVVVGDFEAFQQVKTAVLGAAELPTADAITLRR